jgi:hypothetical protein
VRATRNRLRANRAAGHRDSARLGGGRPLPSRASCGPAAFGARSARTRAACLPADGWLGPPYSSNGHARRLSRAPRGTPHHGRRAVPCGCAFVSARPSSRRIRAFRPDIRHRRFGACQSRPHARRLGGWWGASRSERQAAGVPLARGRRAGLAQPRATAVGAAKARLRDLLARRERSALNDDRRDGRGGRYPAARSGAGDDPSLVGKAHRSAIRSIAVPRDTRLVALSRIVTARSPRAGRPRFRAGSWRR